MEALKLIYSAFRNDKAKKERFEMILEPLQAISQLAFYHFVLLEVNYQ